MKRIFKIFILLILVLGYGISSGSEGMSLELQHAYKACKNDFAAACFELGEVYREGAAGAGIEANLSIAKSYYQKACDDGFDKGCFRLENLRDLDSNEK